MSQQVMTSESFASIAAERRPPDEFLSLLQDLLSQDVDAALDLRDGDWLVLDSNNFVFRSFSGTFGLRSCERILFFGDLKLETLSKIFLRAR